MNKSDLRDAVHAKVKKTLRMEISKEKISKMIEIVFSEMESGLKKRGRIRLINFASLSLVKHRQRQGRNPATGQVITIPQRIGIRFSPSKRLKEYINK